MKKPETNKEPLRRILSPVSLRMLKKTVDHEINESSRWTPFEGIPVSIPVSEFGKIEAIRPA